jgi:hypothetical protein
MDNAQETQIGISKKAQVVCLGRTRSVDPQTGGVTEKGTLMFRLVGEEFAPRLLPGDFFEADTSVSPQQGKLAIFLDAERNTNYVTRVRDHVEPGGVLLGAVVGCYGGPANM